jgi:hypothetical protein
MMTARQRKAMLLGTIGMAGAAFAQATPVATPAKPVNSAASLRLPENPVIYGAPLPQVVKATAIVNGEVITPDRHRPARGAARNR